MEGNKACATLGELVSYAANVFVGCDLQERQPRRVRGQRSVLMPCLFIAFSARRQSSECWVSRKDSQLAIMACRKSYRGRRRPLDSPVAYFRLPVEPQLQISIPPKILEGPLQRLRYSSRSTPSTRVEREGLQNEVCCTRILKRRAEALTISGSRRATSAPSLAILAKA